MSQQLALKKIYTPVLLGIAFCFLYFNTAAAQTVRATLVNTIETFRFSPPGPDAAGVVYLPSTNRLLIADSEVDEMAIYAGVNLFETTLGGSLVKTYNTLSFSREPTGVAVSPSHGHFFFSDDDQKKIFEINLGPDGTFNTTDDVVTSFGTASFGSNDPEDVTFESGQGSLFIIDGVNTKAYRVIPGANGRFDGPPPSGDDIVSSFDTTILGVSDPEGISYNPDNNTLFIVGKPATLVIETTLTGALVRKIDISAAKAIKPAGLTYAPASGAGAKSLYIAERGIDNNANPTENDGKVYEMSFSGSSGDITAPAVSLTAPVNNATVSGPTTVSATASDNVGVAGVQFKLDGQNLGAEDIVSPYTTSWNTSQTPNGTHTLVAVVRDLAGNTKTSSSVTITVSNSGSTVPNSDLNNDGRVDVIDLGILLAVWGNTTKPKADINQDGRVDVVDLGILLSKWG